MIDIGRDFSRFPGGRTKSDGRYSAELFRESILLPVLHESESVTVLLDTAEGLGSSFLEETFGGLVRIDKFDPEELVKKLQIVSEDKYLIEEIFEYIRGAADEKTVTLN